MNKAIVIGGHVQGLGIVRALGRLGFTVSVLDHTKVNIARHSKYCSSFNEVLNSELLSYLLSKRGIDSHQGSIIFPTNDEHVEYLSQNLDELSKYYIPATDTWEVIKKCFNKRLTYSIAEKVGIPLAKTCCPDSVDELDTLKGEINYPCIIKPAVMYRFYNSFKQKVFICNNGDELTQNYLKALTIIPANEIIIQDIIPGGSEYLYSVGCLFNRDEVIASLTARRARQHPIDFGNATTYAETVNEPKLEELAFKMLEKIKYRGLCEVEFKKDPRDGEFKFLEINPRTWKWHSIASKAEVPLIKNYIELLSGNIPQKTKNSLQASWSHYLTDIPTVIQMLMKNIYKKPDKKNHIQAVLDLKDLKPALFEIIYFPYLIISR